MKLNLLTQSPLQRRISLAFGLFSAAAFILWIGYLWINRLYVPSNAPRFFETFLSILIYVPLATLLTYRRPENLISWLLALFILLRMFAIPRDLILISLMKDIAPTPLLLLGVNLWPWLSGLTFSFLAYAFVLFPDGRLPGPRWRFVRWLLGFQMISTAVWILLFSTDLFRSISAAAGQGGTIELMPMGAGPLSLALVVRPLPLQNGFFLPTAVTALALIVSGLVSQVVRFRRGNPIERQQIKWVIFVMILWAFSVALIVIPSEITFNILAFVSPLPGVAITLAIFRYRLYDIDIIINRTLVYGSLTAILLMVYYGSVVLLESLTRNLAGTDSPFGIVVATLLIAALFQPLRRRIQDLIDRAFFRSKYDAEKTLHAFAATARDEVSIRKLSQALLVTVEDAVQPVRLSLMIQPAVRRRERPAVPREHDSNDVQRN